MQLHTKYFLNCNPNQINSEKLHYNYKIVYKMRNAYAITVFSVTVIWTKII